MAREIREYPETWQDRFFEKSLKKLGDKEKESLAERLGSLIENLYECRHPISDPRLGSFKPTPYRVHLRSPNTFLAEYRLDKRCRVIVAYFDHRDEILLVAISVDHDHPRLKVLIERFDSRPAEPEPEKENDHDVGVF